MTTDTYAHHLPFLKASSVHPHVLPHLGAPSTRLAQAFLDSYQSTVHLFRTPTFADNLRSLGAESSPATLLSYLTFQLDHADSRFHPIVANELSRVLALGAALGRRQVYGAFDLHKAVSGALPARVAAQKLPKPLFPYLPIPRFPSSIRIPRSRRIGRGQAPLEHIEAAKGLSLDLIQRINAHQRALVGGYVTEAITRGLDVDTTAMRVANVVGLFPRWARAVGRLHSSMLANGVNPRIAQARADTYADELRLKRAKMISRTELIRAMATGRQNSWREMADQGVIDPENSVREWSAAPGACDVCEELGDPNGEGVGTRVKGLETPFDTPLGLVLGPPIHPNDRCSVLLHPAFLSTPQTTTGQQMQDEAVISDPELQQLQT